MLRRGAQIARWHDMNAVTAGWGYVDLPLVVELGKKRETIGFDLSRVKIEHAVPDGPVGGHCIGVDPYT